MHRPSALLLGLAAVLVSLSLPAPAPAGAAQSASVTLEQCATGLSPDARFAVFVGRMRPVERAAGLQLRFILEARDATGAWRLVAGEKLGQWRTSDAGVRGFVFTKRVERLPAPGAYRTVVHYRWLDAHGDVVRRARRVSAVCRQPGPRQDPEGPASTIPGSS